jgi:hypothetical protein
MQRQLELSFGAAQLHADKHLVAERGQQDDGRALHRSAHHQPREQLQANDDARSGCSELRGVTMAARAHADRRN